MGMEEQDIQELWAITASVLGVGQVAYTGTDKAKVSGTEAVDIVAELLQCDKSKLQSALVSRQFEAGRGQKAIQTHLSKEKAEYTRDSLAKIIYFRLFDQIVRYINKAISTDNIEEVNINDTVTIGVLDIYGFEIFESNSFEQFCINFVNEKLQQIFINKVIQLEQEEYKAEGIKWEPVKYFNNKVVCDLIEKKRGIIAFLDEECVMAQGSDAKLLDKLARNLKEHKHFDRPTGVKDSRDEFIVKHYAGDVRYNVNGFLDKNKDLVWKDILELGESSSLNAMKKMFPKGLSARMGKARPTTAGTHFKKQVAALVKLLNQCTPHYVRCIKPNNKKMGGLHEDELVMHQIKYLGLLENVRVRRAGFAFRQKYDVFLRRYKMVAPSTWPLWNGSDEEGCMEVMKALGFSEGTAYQRGKTKLFIREPKDLFALEEKREEKLHDVVIMIQKTWRKWQARKYFLEMREKALGVFGREKLRRKVSVSRFPRGDYIQAQNHVSVKELLTRDGAKFRFCDKVQKINRKRVSQERILMLTSRHIYNLKSKNKDKQWVQQRRIDIANIASISLSTKADGIMVLHVANEYDYVYACDRKTEFVTALKEDYLQVTQRELELKIKDNISYKLKKGGEQTITIVDNNSVENYTHGPDPQSKTNYLVQVGPIECVNEQYIASLAPKKMQKTQGAKPKMYMGSREAKRAASNQTPKAVKKKETVRSPPAPSRKKNEVWAVAVDDYQGEDGELHFKKGTKIKILEQHPSGWWTGQIGQEIGYVPNTYLDLDN
jgi:myosin-1